MPGHYSMEERDLLSNYLRLCDTMRNLMVWNISPQTNLVVADQQKRFVYIPEKRQ